MGNKLLQAARELDIPRLPTEQYPEEEEDAKDAQGEDELNKEVQLRSDFPKRSKHHGQL
jgi:hypothetical protein